MRKPMEETYAVLNFKPDHKNVVDITVLQNCQQVQPDTTGSLESQQGDKAMPPGLT